MIPERWFLRELKLISPKVYPFWFSKYKKWFLVRDFPRRIPGITDYDPIVGKNFIVEQVLQDEKGRALYLNAKVLLALKMQRYERHRYSLNEYLRRIDEAEKQKAIKAEQFRREGTRDFIKDVNKLSTTKTFS